MFRAFLLWSLFDYRRFLGFAFLLRCVLELIQLAEGRPDATMRKGKRTSGQRHFARVHVPYLDHEMPK